MVWLPGGAFVRGANSVPIYDGSAFARDGIVLVAVNYRLGVPGFAVLDGAPTNLGLRDQIAALEWVRDNVAAFGGDADDVTVFGESAGGMSVATLMACPAAEGLFHRAVIQSGGGTSVCTLEDARRVSAEVAAHLGVPATADAFAALDPEVVTAAQSAVALAVQADPDPQRWGATVLNGGLGIMTLFPVIDGDLVPDVPLARIAQGSAAAMPLLIGTTREEFRLFLVPTGVAATLTSQALPSLAARYGWPARAVETYTANRPGASPGTSPAPSSRMRRSERRRRGSPPPSTPPVARFMPTSSAGRRPSRASGPVTPSSSRSSSTPSPRAHPWSGRPRPGTSPTRCTGPGSPSDATVHRGGDLGRRTSAPSWSSTSRPS